MNANVKKPNRLTAQNINFRRKMSDNPDAIDAFRILKPIVLKNYILREREKGDFLLAFYLGKRKIINQTAKDILESCDGKNSIEKISQTISAKYKVDQKKTLNDTMLFLLPLTREGVISFKQRDVQRIFK